MDRLTRWLVTFGVAAVLGVFFSVPLLFILYGGAGAMIGGFMLLAPFMLAQYPLLLLFRRLSGRRGAKNESDGD